MSDEQVWMTGPARTILSEFYDRIQESLVILAMSRRGLLHVGNEFMSPPGEPPPDITISVSAEPVDGRVVPNATIHRSKLYELIDMGAEDRGRGQAFVWLSQQWIVLTYAMWEDNFRPRIAAAAGVKLDEIKVDALGDLRHMRHDIAHHLGRASRGHSSRCVIFRWFKPGDLVWISAERISEVVNALPGYDLEWGPAI